MKAFLEEYGIAVFTMVCVGLLIVMATPVGEAIREMLLQMINRFVTDPQNFQAAPAFIVRYAGI